MYSSKFFHYLVTSVLLLCSITTAQANPSKTLIDSFVQALSAANQPTTTKTNVEHYLSFMSDDITDFHAAYNVTQSGKQKKMENMLNNVKSRKSFKIELDELILGTDTAVMVINEESVYLKHNKIKEFKGRTIWVLEFNEADKITHMRRYLDWN